MFVGLSALVFVHSILYAQAHLHIPLVLYVFRATRTIVGSNGGFTHADGTHPHMGPSVLHSVRVVKLHDDTDPRPRFTNR